MTDAEQPVAPVEEQQAVCEASPAGDAPAEQVTDPPTGEEAPVPPSEDGAAAEQTQEAAVPPAGGEPTIDAAQAAAHAAAVAARLMASHVNQFAQADAELNNKRPREEVDEEGGPDKKRASAGALDDPNGLGGADPVVPGGPMEILDVPSGMVGKLIGKAGETIRNLQLTTDTRIQVDHAAEGDTKRVTITGMSAEAVAKCRDEINGILHDDETKEELECPAGIVGRIIGRGGETIRALQSASQAHITVDQNFPEGQPRKIIVQGRVDACRRASTMIKELITGEPGSAQAIIQRVCAEQGIGKTHVMTCPKGIVGRIIGRQGDTIKQLQRVTGATIQIDQSTDPCRVTLAGQPSSSDQAKRMIEGIIAGGDPFHPGGPMGGYGGPPGYGAPFGAPPGGFGAPQFGSPYGAPFGGGFPPYGGGFAPYGGGAVPYGGMPGAYGAPGGYGADPYAAAAAGAYGAAGAAGYGADPSGAGAGGQWQELHDDQGRPYYYNPSTGVTQWEKPPGM